MNSAMTVQVSKRLAPVAVSSTDEASRVVRQYIGARGATWFYGQTPAGLDGAIVCVDGRQVARISYNGRVWPVAVQP